MRALPRRQQPYRGSCLGTILPKQTTRSLATIHGASTGLQYNHMQEAIPIATGKLLWNDTRRQQDCSRLFMSRVPVSKRITFVHHQDGNNRNGEVVVGQHSPTPQSLAPIHVVNTGIKYNVVRALPRGNNRSGEALVTPHPTNTIARDHLCRE